MRSIDASFYKSKKWLKTQQLFMSYKDNLCERCLSKGKVEPAKIVHHKIHLNPNNVKDDSIAYGFENLEALCQSCHNEEHFGRLNRKRWSYDESGHLVIDDSRDDVTDATPLF